MTKLEKSQHQMTDKEYQAWTDYMSSQSYSNECYACSTQRYACEHDNWEEYQCGNDDYPEWWEEV